MFNIGSNTKFQPIMAWPPFQTSLQILEGLFLHVQNNNENINTSTYLNIITHPNKKVLTFIEIRYP